MADQRAPVRVLIVDDSEVAREVLKIVLEGENDIVVVGEGRDAFSAARLVEELRPDVVTMDVEMPGKSGLEAVEQIMARCPVPIVVVTSEPIHDTPLAFSAIERGAMEIVTKPALTDADSGSSLRALVRSLSHVPVFQFTEHDSRITAPPPADPDTEVVVVAAGPGGLPSIVSLVSRLPAQLRFPMLLHYYVVPELGPSLTRYLAGACKCEVRPFEGERISLTPGCIILAHHQPVEFVSPLGVQSAAGSFSASGLFHSLARVHRSKGVGVLLGGVGTDGVEGLLALRLEGARTYAEAVPVHSALREAPHSAITSGAITNTCPIEQLASALS